MSKLIFCFDGTCNEPADYDDIADDENISNVLKMHILFGGGIQEARDKRQQNAPKGQKSFYYSGIGTRGFPLFRLINMAFAPPSMEMKDILEEATADLKANYKKGDEIFIFGFSRGAAIARMFAAKHIGKKPVKLLGVFDTVAATVATKDSLDFNAKTFPASGVVFENGTVGKHVKNAVHLVAIDEQRMLFQPTLFNHDKRVKEVWFAGVHSDVGGGFWHDALSDTALKFMLSEAERHGLARLPEDKVKFADKALKPPLKNIAGANMGNFTSGEASMPNTPKTEAPLLSLDNIAINCLEGRGKIHQQQRKGTIKERTMTPRKIRVNVGDKPSDKHLPILHWTVANRFHNVSDYRPAALRGVSFRVMGRDGEVGKKIQGIAGLRQEK
jgi:uncharacterized protein (DUF2235 family)